MRSNCASAHERGIFVTKPTIPGIQSFPLACCFGRLEFVVVPGLSKFPELASHRPWEIINQPVMQPQPESNRTKTSQRNVVSREIDTLKPVDLLKPAQRAFFLSLVSKV